MYSYLHNESGDTQYNDRARRIRFDEFSALRHGDVVIVRTFVLCVMSCKSRDHVGTIEKPICLFSTFIDPITRKSVVFDCLNRLSYGNVLRCDS